MSIIKDAIASMKEVILISEKVERVGDVLTELSKEVRGHNDRLVRIETIIEMGIKTALPKK
jgi:hypothetical protein